MFEQMSGGQDVAHFLKLVFKIRAKIFEGNWLHFLLKQYFNFFFFKVSNLS